MKIGFTIGKFAPLHKGHQYLIEKGLKEMDEFYVVIYDTCKISIPIETRANWIKSLYPNCHILYAKNPPNEYGLDEKSVKIQNDYLKKIMNGINVTHFYSSEDYGKFVAKSFCIQEVLVDKLRLNVPISGTKIRDNLNNNINFVDDIVLKDLNKETSFN